MLNAVPDSRRSLGDPAPAEVDWNKPSCRAPGCLVIDHGASVGLVKKKKKKGYFRGRQSTLVYTA